MKHLLTSLAILSIIHLSNAQKLTYQLKSSAPRSISNAKLQNANSINDIYDGFPQSWIDKYVSVTITTTNCEGQHITNIGSNNQLTKEQIYSLRNAKIGTELYLNVEYYPDNSLIFNDIKSLNYTFLVTPFSQASFAGQYGDLEQYLHSNIGKKHANQSNSWLFASIKFMINVEGQIKNVQLVRSSENSEFDDLLMNSIVGMPNWNPAKDSDGNTLEQEFIISYGNMEGC